MKDRILIISYVYPPSTGIGGRRWSKFAKYLNKSGSDIYLLTLKPDREAVNRLNEYDSIKSVSHLKNVYPKVLGTQPNSVFEKVKYKIALLFVQVFSKGNYYDRSVFFKNQFLNEATNLIEKHNIEKVIITGAPFRMLYYGVLLKKKHNIRLLSDIRDPWTWGAGYGMKLLSKRRKEKELFYEKQVLIDSDVVTVPVAPMLGHLQNVYSKQASKIKLLSHAYDLDDFEIGNATRKLGDSYRLVYGGTTYRNLEEEYDALYELCKSSDNVDFNIQIHTNKFQYLNNDKKGEIKSKLEISPYITPSEINTKIKNADAYLLIFPDEVKDFITTKFYEIIYCQTPIIFVGAKGVVSEFIVENGLGVHISPCNLKEELNEILSGHKSISFNKNFSVEDYSFEKVTDILVSLLEK